MALKVCPECGVPMSPLPQPTGGTIRFGMYEWRVLERVDGNTLILSERVIDKKAYHGRVADITWENCDLRRYLNGEFLHSFSASDQARIVETGIPNNNNPWYGTSGGNPTKDRIFCLSIEEVVKYLGDSGQLQNQPKNVGNGDWLKEEYVFWICDQYDVARIALEPSGAAYWWRLRSPGISNRFVAAVVGNDGETNGAGGINVGGINQNIVDGYFTDEPTDITDENGGVRPALWLRDL
ncbi:MAG: DUF6273 domain-containing protein [Anaerolineae bacterium]